MLSVSLNDFIQEKASQFTQAASSDQATQDVSPSFPDTPWTPGHHGRPLRMISFDDMAVED